MARRLITALTPVTLAAFLFSGIGCAGRPALPEIIQQRFQGPPLSIDPAGAEYAVVVRAPTPGWVVGLDRVSEEYHHQAVFITLRTPSPAFMYPQVEVEQRVATSVATTGAVKVYARVLRFDEKTGSSPYQPAAQSEGSRKRR